MVDIEVKTKMLDSEEKLRVRYSKISKLFLILGIILVIWAIVVFVGAKILDFGYDWAGLSVSSWILGIAVILIVFIVIELIVFLHYYSVKNKRVEVEKPKEEFISGRKVHAFTFPMGMEGGIFSKTYIEVDEDNILRLRTLMIPPEDLWGK